MNKNNQPANPIAYWPILVGAVAALAVPFLFAPVPTPMEKSEDSPPIHQVEEMTVATNSPDISETDTRLDPPKRLEPSPQKVPDEPYGAEDPDPSPSIPTPLLSRTADWRYLGGIVSSRRSVARIQRMENPERISLVKEGDRLEGVAVAEIASASIRVLLAGETRILPLETGPAFDLDDVLIPEEALDDPEILASVVFAQTLGRYLAEQPDFSAGEGSIDPTGESLFEALDSLSGAASLVPPGPGETPEEWAQAAAEGMATDTHSEIDPTGYPLSEEDRLKILGVDRLQGE